ncbi:MAG: FAD-binding oxidoreductase [Alphaproteobacteria bacterium]|nr:FAD-binding oxidoreductase [Alphaproteobacteria bacterium]
MSAAPTTTSDSRDPGRPLWAASAPAAEDPPPLEGVHETEVVVIGAGFSGLAAALALAERRVPVVVLEAGSPGAGASGLSGGQVIPGLRHHPADLVAAYGETLGLRLHAFGAGAAEALWDIVDRHAIACDADRGGWVQGAENAAALAEAGRRVRSWQAIGAPVDLLDRDETRARTGAEGYVGGWIHRGGGVVQPLAFARGLAAAAVAAGARLHGHSAALRILADGAGWRVETARGAARARRVLIATNALAGALWPGLARSILPVWSYQAATAPGTAPAHGLMVGAAAVSDTRRVLRYFRRDAAGRVVVGGKGLLRAPRSEGDFALQRRMIGRLFPALADAPFAHRWGGQVAVTLDRLPRLFALAPGVWATIGCNGKGVAWCTALGAPLAALLSGTPARDLPLPPEERLREIPFHALKTVYAAVGSLWLRLQDRFADPAGA